MRIIFSMIEEGRPILYFSENSQEILSIVFNTEGLYVEEISHLYPCDKKAVEACFKPRMRCELWIGSGLSG